MHYANFLNYDLVAVLLGNFSSADHLRTLLCCPTNRHTAAAPFLVKRHIVFSALHAQTAPLNLLVPLLAVSLNADISTKEINEEKMLKRLPKFVHKGLKEKIVYNTAYEKFYFCFYRISSLPKIFIAVKLGNLSIHIFCKRMPDQIIFNTHN